jgi:hypothetical protein
MAQKIHVIFLILVRRMAQRPKERSSFSSEERSINESNLKYLSQIQNPSINKLISTLASDIPLDPIRIRQKLFGVSVPSFDEPRQEEALSESLSSSKKRIHRNIRCTTDPNLLSPQLSPDRQTNLPTNYLGSLFSPSVFKSPSSSVRYFTFEHHGDESTALATPSPHSRSLKESAIVVTETPRFDEKELYAVLCESKFLDSPRQLQLVPQTPVRDDIPNISIAGQPLSSFKKSSYQPFDPEADIGPDDFLALETWFNQPLNHPTLFEGGEVLEGARGQQHSSSYHSLPESSAHPLQSYNSNHIHDFKSAEGIHFTLPSIPNLPQVTPSISVVDLDNLLKANHLPSHSAALLDLNSSTSSLPSLRLPSLPSIPFSIPMPLPFPLTITLPHSTGSSTDHSELDPRGEEWVRSDDDQPSEAHLPSGTMALCKQLLKYCERQCSEMENGETESGVFSCLDPEVVSKALNLRPRRVKEILAILDALQVV